MAWNGTGTFARLYNWVSRAANPATKYIDATTMDAEFDNFKGGLENCLTRSGETTPTANQAMSNFRHTSVGAATSLTDYARVNEVQKGTIFRAASPGGTIDAMTATVTPAPSLTAGQIVTIIAPGTGSNTVTNPTLTLNGGSAVTIRKSQTALAVGDYSVGDTLFLVYDGTYFELTNPKNAVTVTNPLSAFTTDATGGDVADFIPFIDTSESSANNKVLVPDLLTNALASITAKTAPIAADTLMVGDSAASNAVKRSTVENFYKTIVGVTEDTTPDIADSVLTYDTSASAAKRSTVANLYKTINGLTTDSTPDASADFIPTYDTSASGPKKVSINVLQTVSVPSASGLVVKNNTGAPNTQIDITADHAVLVNSSGAAKYVSGVSLNVNFATTGANALDTGSHASSTWYYVWIISNGTTTAGLGSTSSTSPTMPSGYTYKMRVGAVRTNGSTQFMLTNQRGRNVRYQLKAGSTTTIWPNIATGAVGSVSTPTYVSTSIATQVPPTAVTVCLTAAIAATASNFLAAPSADYGNSSSTTAIAPFVVLPDDFYGVGGVGEVQLETSQTIFVAQNGGNLNCLGWVDAINA
jgi:hypothetical protein